MTFWSELVHDGSDDTDECVVIKDGGGGGDGTSTLTQLDIGPGTESVSI